MLWDTRCPKPASQIGESETSDEEKMVIDPTWKRLSLSRVSRVARCPPSVASFSVTEVLLTIVQHVPRGRASSWVGGYLCKQTKGLGLFLLGIVA